MYVKVDQTIREINSGLEKAAEWTHLGYQNSVMPNLLAVDKMPIWQVYIYLAKVMSFEPQQ